MLASPETQPPQRWPVLCPGGALDPWTPCSARARARARQRAEVFRRRCCFRAPLLRPGPCAWTGCTREDRLACKTSHALMPAVPVRTEHAIQLAMFFIRIVPFCAGRGRSNQRTIRGPRPSSAESMARASVWESSATGLSRSGDGRKRVAMGVQQLGVL